MGLHVAFELAHLRFGFVFADAVLLLQAAEQLIAASGDDVELVVG